MASHTSRAFTVYCKHFESIKHLTFHALRRTYYTELAKNVGPEMARLISGHSSGTAVLQNHYLNTKEIMVNAKTFSVFRENQSERQKELQTIRKATPENTVER